RFLLAGVIVLALAGLAARADDVGVVEGLRTLKGVYATRPQGYPTGKRHAEPDRAAPFRWHGYRDGAVRRWEEARMGVHVEPYNPLEDAGVSAERPVEFDFVAEHVTSGRKSLRVRFPAAAVRAGSARVQVHCTA